MYYVRMKLQINNDTKEETELNLLVSEDKHSWIMKLENT